MRDVRTVPEGERVIVHLQPYVSAIGTYKGIVRDRILVENETARQFVPIGDEDWYVTDMDGRVLGVPEEEPSLVGDPPELE